MAFFSRWTVAHTDSIPLNDPKQGLAAMLEWHDPYLEVHDGTHALHLIDKPQILQSSRVKEHWLEALLSLHELC